MSVPHHGNKPDPAQEAVIRRLMDQIEGRAKRAYSEGRLNAQDDGDLAFAVAADKAKGIVIIDFGKPVEWVGLPPKQVAALCELLMSTAREISTEPLVVRL